MILSDYHRYYNFPDGYLTIAVAATTRSGQIQTSRCGIFSDGDGIDATNSAISVVNGSRLRTTNINPFGLSLV